MRSLQHARVRARTCRTAVGAVPDGLFERVVRYLLAHHTIELHPANEAFLEGGRAEVSPAEGCLFYDARLENDPAEKLLVILHELGHLELHPRLQRCCAPPDPVYGSMYLHDGAPALVRYNPRSHEEAEANAFAAEFLCPSRDLLHQWCTTPDETSTGIAQRLGVPVYLVHAQLAEALYETTVEDDPRRHEQHSEAFAYDPSQLQAVAFTGRPALVNAGPGTGKTATLVRRVAYLCSERGAAPEQVLVLTFSNAAAEELRERIAVQCGEAYAARIEVCTFHSFGVAFLHHHGHLLHLDANASVLDEAGQEELVTGILGTVRCGKIVNLQDPAETVQAIVRHVGHLKDRLDHPAHFAAALDAWHPAPDEQKRCEAAQEFLGVYRAYEEAKTVRQHIDFADLIALPIRILDANPALVAQYREKYTWVMVDEYQDVSRAVATLLRYLCGPDNPPWVVGDARQAIYRFRGAAPENVEQFAQDFPGARVFQLDTNYRSCAAIIRAANQLATLMEAPAHEETAHRERWKPGTQLTALSEPAVTIVRADSDHAEQEAIAACVEAWLHKGVVPREIAVLARRNVDVRDIVLALGRKGIRATTTGLVTPEGAAGDLAAIATLADHARASLPRLAFALGRGRFRGPAINAVITRVLETLEEGTTFARDGYAEGDGLVADMQHVCDRLCDKYFSDDAFAMMCAFLFDASGYLRRLLDQPDGPERSLALGEIITSLAQAAGYRCTHPATEPRVSRQGFGQYFRASLCASSPYPRPPQPTADTVRVMTCHAAKGLEFPCVIVAGQTLAHAPRGYRWLPPALTPSAQDDAAQADALFFVGATRAQQTLVVTYATSAGGTPRSRKREVTPLLCRWQTTHALHTSDAPSQRVERERVTMNAVWGGMPRGALATRALDTRACAIRTYLEHYLQVSFPPSIRSLYPVFFAATRRAMARVVRRAHAREMPISRDEAEGILLEGWPMDEIADHPHHALYLNVALGYMAQFAHAYTPQPKARTHLALTVGDGELELLLRLDLIAHYQADDGTSVAIAFRPESLEEKSRAQGVLWSGLSPAHRASFVMLKGCAPRLRPYVFSAEDGVLYPYLWTNNTSAFAQEADRMAQRCTELAQRTFATTVQEWTCDRCPVRVSCPYWMGALGDASHPSRTVVSGAPVSNEP